jgi:biotin operon repressor
LIVRKKNDWQEKEYILRQFSETKGRAVRDYRKFMEEGIAQGRRNDLVGGGLVRSLGGWSQVLSLRRKEKRKTNHDVRILGGEDFVGQILKEADKALRRQLQLGVREDAIGRVIKELCREEGIEEEEVRNGGKRKKVSEVRAKISYRLSHEMGIPFAEIARQVGVCTSAVAKAVQSFESGG